MAATVTGTFVLLDRATGPLRRIQQQADRTDRALAMAGDRLDRIGTREQMAKHEAIGKKLRESGDSAKVLTERLDKTEGASKRAARATGALSGAMGGAAIQGRSFGSVITVLGTALALLSPIIVDVGGALGALVGSLGRALKGAAALSVGGVGVLAVAIGGLAATTIPAITNLGKLSEAFNAVTEAQQKYGKGSKEAREAMKEMAQTRKSLENFDVKRGMAVITGFDSIKEEWTKMTSKGQSAILQMIIDTLNTTRSMMPMLARSANEIASATGVMMRTLLERLDGPEFRRFVNTMTDVYEKVAKPLGETFANIAEALGNIAVAASDELVRLADVLRDASRGWLESSSAVGEMGKMIAAASREMGDWYDLLKASWDWLVALFGPGANQGQGLVQAMTDKLNEQTQWFRTNTPTLQQFYKTADEGTRRFARVLGDIAPTFYEISEALRPVTQAIQELVSLLGDIKIGDISALTLGVFGMGLGRIGNMVRDFGGAKFLSTGGLQAIMGAGSTRGWISGEGGVGTGGGVYRGLGPFELLAGVQSSMNAAQAEMLAQQQGMPSPDDAVGDLADLRTATVGLGRRPGVMPVFVTGGTLSGIGGAGRGGGGAPPLFIGGGGGMASPDGPASRIPPGGAPWWSRVPGLNRMFPAMTTIGARMGMAGQGMVARGGLAGRAAGLGMGLGRLGMGVARFAGRAFLPLAALMGIGDFLSTEGGIGQKLQGAASGATLGLIPKPLSEEEKRNEAMKPLFDRQGPLRLDPRSRELLDGTSFTSRAGMGPGGSNDVTRQVQDILAPFRERRAGMMEARRLELNRRREIQRNARRLGRDVPQYDPLSPVPSAREMAMEDDKAGKQIAAISKAQGKARGRDIVEGMSIMFESGQGRKALERGMNVLFRALNRNKDWSAKTREGVAGGVLAAAKIIQRENPKLKGLYDDLSKKVEDRLGSVGRKVTVVNGNIVTGTGKKWAEMRDAMTTEAERARQETRDKFTAIQNQALGVLVNMGINRSRARRMIQSREGLDGNSNYGLGSGGYGGPGGPGGPGQAGGPGGGGNGAYGMRIKGFAGGGRLKGMGHRDTVPLTLGMAAPGELVVNRHTEGRVDQMLGRFGTSLGKEVGNENVPHSATPRPGRGPGRPHIYHARGGRVAYPDAMGALPGLDALAYFLKQKFGLSVDSGLRPGAITSTGNPSDHGWGGAIDVSNGYATPQMDAAHAWLQSTFAGAIKQMLYRTMVGGDHFDHIHIALNESYARNPQAVARLAGGGGGAVGGMIAGGRPQQINLRAPQTGRAGGLGAMVQAASNLMTGGLEQHINRQLRGGGGRGMRGGGGATVRGKATYFGGGMMASGLNTDVNPGIALNPNPGGPDPGSWDNETTRGWLENRQRFLVRVGGKSAVLPMLDKGPAGWTGNAIDVNMAGLAKMGYTTGTFPSGTVGTATALARGGRVPFGGWFGDGGRFVTNGPTLIGVGEKGKETVQVTPAGKSAGGGGIKIGAINIQNHRKGDIQKQVKEEISAAFSELEREVNSDTGNGMV